MVQGTRACVIGLFLGFRIWKKIWLPSRIPQSVGDTDLQQVVLQYRCCLKWEVQYLPIIHGVQNTVLRKHLLLVFWQKTSISTASPNHEGKWSSIRDPSRNMWKFSDLPGGHCIIKTHSHYFQCRHGHDKVPSSAPHLKSSPAPWLPERYPPQASVLPSFWHIDAASW